MSRMIKRFKYWIITLYRSWYFCSNQFAILISTQFSQDSW